MKESLSQKNLVPRSMIGEELHGRFKEFPFRKNPGESPMAQALVAQGYDVKDYPLHSKYTDSDWLASVVSMKGLSIVFRQPTLTDLLVCLVKRELDVQEMRSPLFGTVEFFAFCRDFCPEITYVGGCIDKFADQQASKNLKMDRLIAFYNRILGYVEAYENNGCFWIYADMRCKERFETLPVWRRHRKYSANKQPNI